jgi:DNA-binding HxlR family transcriptional regulator
MARADFGQMYCTVARSLDVVGDPWTPLILRDLFAGLSRFDQIANDLGISRNLLAQRLDHLTQAGVVERRRYEDSPPRHDYVLTASGRDLAPVLVALVTWGDRWARPAEGSPITFRHACGETVTPVLTCPHCGEPATGDSLTAEPGPGARVAPGTTIIAALAGAPAAGAPTGAGAALAGAPGAGAPAAGAPAAGAHAGADGGAPAAGAPAAGAHAEADGGAPADPRHTAG